MPRSEGQLRPLFDLPIEARVSAWQAVVEDTAPAALSGRAIAIKVREHATANNIPLNRIAHTSAPPAKRAAEALNRLRAATAAMKKAKQISALLRTVEALIRAE